jgi:hypothetical protein
MLSACALLPAPAQQVLALLDKPPEDVKLMQVKNRLILGDRLKTL